MERRKFLQSAAVVPASGILASTIAGCESNPTQGVPAGISPFQHGVASGDPQQDRVILWSRVSPPQTDPDTALPTRWWISKEESGASPVAQGELLARAEHDFTLKVDATGLAPDQSYYYAFEHAGHRSRVGRTRTLPAAGTSLGGSHPVRLAVTSCANYPQGYFNAYRHIAEDPNLNAVLSLGDYLYEYAEGEYGEGAALGRIPEPTHEILSLADYRLRHAQHKADNDLQAAHAAHPWIVIWDDHESANDSWLDGAQNHNPEKNEGSWSTRKAAAVKAYYEWMPIRELPSGLFRHFRFGQLADLVMLDTRLAGRDKQAEANDLETARSTERTLLGPIQEQLFFDHLSATSSDQVRWKLVGQQIVFAPWSDADQLLNPDSWDGYQASRNKVLTHLENGGIDDVIILSGDVHSSWGMNVPNSTRTRSQAIELVTPAVSSPPLASASPQTQALVERAPQEQSHIKYAEGLNNGYLIVGLQQDSVQAQWYSTGPRTERSNDPVLQKTLVSLPGTNQLTELA